MRLPSVCQLSMTVPFRSVLLLADYSLRGAATAGNGKPSPLAHDQRHKQDDHNHAGNEVDGIQRPQSSSASRRTAGALGFLIFTQLHSTQQRWKGRRGLSPFSCCAILVLLPTNSAKTVTDSLPASLIQSIRTLLSV